MRKLFAKAGEDCRTPKASPAKVPPLARQRLGVRQFPAAFVCSFAASVLAGTLPVVAHPGHDLGAYGAAHLITSPYHLAILAGVAVLLWVVAGFIKHRLARCFLQIGAAAIIGCTALLWVAGV